MVTQSYQTDVNVEHVIRGNSVVIKCIVPSFVADHVTLDAWLVDARLIVQHHDDFTAGSSEGQCAVACPADDDVTVPLFPRSVFECLNVLMIAHRLMMMMANNERY